MEQIRHRSSLRLSKPATAAFLEERKQFLYTEISRIKIQRVESMLINTAVAAVLVLAADDWVLVLSLTTSSSRRAEVTDGSIEHLLSAEPFIRLIRSDSRRF